MKVGIVGCGGIASVHCKSLSNIDSVTLAGFCDIKKDRALAFSKEYGGKVYETIDEMLEGDMDVIHICTPHYLHVPMALAALKAEKHVFMEKPPVMTRKELEQLERANELKKTYLGFCFQNRYNPSVLAIKKLLKEKTFGKILGVRGIVTWARHKEYYSESDWRGQLKYEGGGALINQSIHTLDLMDYFIQDEIHKVDAVMTNHHLKGRIEVEDTMSIYLEYKNTIGSFYATNSYAVSTPPLIELECENGRIRMEELEVTCYHKDGRVESLDIEKKQGYGKSYWGVGHQDCIADFYHCMEVKKTFQQDLDGVRNCIHLMLDAYDSAREGKVIEY